MREVKIKVYEELDHSSKPAVSSPGVGTEYSKDRKRLPPRRRFRRRRCVEELGFVGCNLNPDPSGGNWISTPLTDPSWYPLHEGMVEPDVPAMVHVSAVTNPNFHALLNVSRRQPAR